jgi:hypothetical protein
MPMAAPQQPQTLADLLTQAAPRYREVTGQDLLADFRAGWGHPYLNAGISTRLRDTLSQDPQLKPLVEQANKAIQAAYPGLDITEAYKSGKPPLDDLLKVRLPQPPEQKAPEQKAPETKPAEEKPAEAKSQAAEQKAPEKVVEKPEPQPQAQPKVDAALQPLQTAATQAGQSVQQLGTAASTAQTSVQQAGQAATTAGQSLEQAGTSATTVGTGMQTVSTSAQTAGTSLTQAGDQANQAGQQFQQAGQTAASGAQAGAGAGGGATSTGAAGGGTGTAGSGGTDFLGGIGQIAGIGTSIASLMGIKSPVISKLMAGISLISQISKLFSGGGLFGGLGGMFGGGAGGGGLFGGLFSGVGSMFSGLFGGGAGGGLFGGGLFSGIGSMFSFLPFLALNRGGIIPAAAGGMLVSAANDNWGLPAKFGSDRVLSALTPGEMVLPTRISQGLQQAFADGGVKLGGGDVHHYSVSVSAIDSRSGAQFLMNHADVIAGALNRSRRSFRTGTR